MINILNTILIIENSKCSKFFVKAFKNQILKTKYL